MEAVTTEAAARRRPWSTLKVPSGMKSMIMAKREATKPMTIPWKQFNTISCVWNHLCANPVYHRSPQLFMCFCFRYKYLCKDSEPWQIYNCTQTVYIYAIQLDLQYENILSD
jgi:hypothetical protein